MNLLIASQNQMSYHDNLNQYTPTSLSQNLVKMNPQFPLYIYKYDSLMVFPTFMKVSIPGFDSTPGRCSAAVVKTYERACWILTSCYWYHLTTIMCTCILKIPYHLHHSASSVVSPSLGKACSNDHYIIPAMVIHFIDCAGLKIYLPRG